MAGNSTEGTAVSQSKAKKKPTADELAQRRATKQATHSAWVQAELREIKLFAELQAQQAIIAPYQSRWETAEAERRQARQAMTALL